MLDLDLDRLVGDARLVAIAGANGRGQSTVMDNLHPYLTMPSRAAQAGPGGLSFHDHIVGHEGGAWQPARVDDGTVSEGKVESYTRCVETVCGPAQTFFTSVCAAQASGS